MAAKHPLSGKLAKYIENFADSRSPEADYKFNINRQRLYILPTRHGLTFSIMLILVLTGAINYENSLAFMLTFLLASICFLGMLHCHQNLNNLQIICSPANSVFLGQSVHFPINIQSQNRHAHYGLCLETIDSETSCCNLLQKPGETSVTLVIDSTKRGYQQLQKVKIFTEFPLNLFHAWTWLPLKAQCLIYPKPIKQEFITNGAFPKEGLLSSSASAYDDFTGIREHQKEDSPNHLAWKIIAKTGSLKTKQFNATAADQLYLSWFDLANNMDIETRLSVMCYWVIEAEKHGLQYGLIMPDTSIEPDSGLQHYQHCLTKLALFN